MRDILTECRGRLGDVPRRFTILDWSYLDVEAPVWLPPAPCERLSPLQAAVSRLLVNQQALRREGRVSWAVVVRANPLAFRSVSVSAPALVLTSDALDADSDVARLRRQAIELRCAGDTAGAALQRFIAGALAEHAAPEHVPVPAPIGDGSLRLSALYFPPHYVPSGRLSGDFFPVFIAEAYSPMTLPVPAAYWPEDFVNYWVTQDVSALRPSARAALGRSELA